MPATTTIVRKYLGQVRPLLGIEDRWAAHGAKVLDGTLGKAASDFDEGTRYYTFRHVAGFQDEIRDIFDQMDTSSDEGWANIATRLETIAQPLAGWKQTLDEGIARGQVVARRQAESVKEQFEHLAGPDSKFLGLAEAAANMGVAERVKAAAEVRPSSGRRLRRLHRDQLSPLRRRGRRGQARPATSAPPMGSWGWLSIRPRPTNGAGAKFIASRKP